MKKTLLFLSCILTSVFADAQTPMYWNYNTAGTNNSFPFNSTTTRKVQWRILANSLGSVAPGNNITKVYFRINNSGSMTYPLLNISLKQGPNQLQGGGVFDTGFTLVYSGTNVTAGGTAGNWMSFTLQTPFLYNPNLPLLLEVEHNATSGVGIWIDQTSPSGPGFGREWGAFGATNYTGGDASVVHFGIDVVPATPCTAAPPVNTIIPASFTTCAGYANPSLSVATTYSFGGLTYQWYSSTVSPVGPFTSIPNYTLPNAPTSTLGVTTWFSLVTTCTNITTNNATTLTPSQFFVAGQTSSIVPYFEDFEGVQMDNRLPNCSWSATSLGIMNQTSIAPGSGNRLPRSGQKFASFSNAVAGTSYYYTNPIAMTAGITYSAALYYATEHFGYANWSDLSIWVGTSQSPTAMVQIASIGPAISGSYKLLDGTFTIPSSGQYYVAVKATSQSGGATYLSWDDLSVTIPCTPLSGNSPTVTTSTSSNIICDGTSVNLFASGADNYVWYNGSTTSTLLASPFTTTMLTVAGTNTRTNCTTIGTQLIIVNPSPTVFIVADKYAVCPGQQVFLSAFGAISYMWQSTVIAVNPMTTSSYTVYGSNAFGCWKAAVATITVMPQPTLTVSSESPNNESCAGDMVTLNVSGADYYEWYQNTNSLLLQGSQINVTLTKTTIFTVTGKAINTCTNQASVVHYVNACVGLDHLQAGAESVKMFPNPTNGVLQLDLNEQNEKTIEITDVSGRVVFSTITSGTNMKLDLSFLASGLYNTRIKSEEKTYSLKLIKN